MCVFIYDVCVLINESINFSSSFRVTKFAHFFALVLCALSECYFSPEINWLPFSFLRESFLEEQFFEINRQFFLFS